MNTDHLSTVLIVDEHEAVCDVLARRIEGLGGFRVIEATTNPVLAAEIAHEFAPDVIIADFKRGPKPRADMVRWMGEASPQSQLVIYASYYTDGEREAFADAGAARCLLKGMSASELGAALHSLHGHGGAGGPVAEPQDHSTVRTDSPDV
jgi:DNA-binding NarL/FixJ family response regulator